MALDKQKARVSLDQELEGKPRVVEIGDNLGLKEGAAKERPRPQLKRRRLLAISFLLMVAAPILLGSYYFLFAASDRYASGAGFVVRGVESGSPLDGIGVLTGLASSGSTTSDSYIVLKYLESRDLVERLRKDFDIVKAFSSEEIDQISRLGSEATIEELVDYWAGMISTTFDSSSGVVTFEVQAFKAHEALEISNLVLNYTKDLVNELSESARIDTVRFAQAEVERAEERLHKELKSLREFRAQERSIDPTASASLDIELISALESRLIDIKTRIGSISGSVNEDAPSLVSLRQQAKALEEQILAQSISIGEESIGDEATKSISDLLASYETLLLEKNFAEQAYASSLSSLEAARVEADRQQRYLAVFSVPSLPEKAAYPRRVTNIALLSLLTFLFWGIGTLVVYSVRDHIL